MKTLLLSVALCCLAICARAETPSEAQKPKTEQPPKRGKREREREAKHLATERFVDSLVISHNFSFLPSTFTMQPTGSMEQIVDPNMRIDIYPSWVNVTIPYVIGQTPPYKVIVLNKMVTAPEKMNYGQTKTGWEIDFRAIGLTADTLTFRFRVESRTGEVTLEVWSDMRNTVVYTGSLIARN